MTASLRSVPPARAAAIAFGLAAGAATWGYFVSGAGSDARAWLPSAATAFATIALTVSLVEAIVRRESRIRLAPRVDRAMRDVGSAFRMLVRSIAWDYKATHIDTFEPLPAQSLAVLDHWLANVSSEDRERVSQDADDLPLVVAHALQTATSLRRVRESDRDVLEPELVAAIDDFEEDARLAFSIFHGMVDASRQTRAQEAINQVVYATRNLGEVLIRHDRQWLEEGSATFTRPGSWGTDPDTPDPHPPA